MMWKVSIVLLAIAWPFCVRPLPDWYDRQDRRIKMPDFHDPDSIQLVDGVVLQAINVAADDFFGTSSKPRPCSETRAAHLFQVIRGDDIVFVRISENPAACNCQGYSLDGAGRYAISADGRILRRALDLEPDDVEGEDAGPAGEVIELPPNPDGGMPVWELPPVTLNPEYLPPWFGDPGILVASPDGGVSRRPSKLGWPCPIPPKAAMVPDAGTRSDAGTPTDAGTPADAGARSDAGTAR